jgi:hypothetical protein
MARGENARGKSKTLEILPHTNVPVYIILENEGCGEVLFDDSVLVLVRSLLQFSSQKMMLYFRRAVICVLQLPLMPGRSLRFSSGGGYALWLMLSPITPSTNSSLMFEMAAESDMASRRSVRKGRLSTKIFWNLYHVSIHSRLCTRQLVDIHPVLCSGYPVGSHPSNTRTSPLV